MNSYDVAIAGGGPAGAVCALVCARAGMKVLVLERARFPRDKVCGDCLNPGCWPVFERLELLGAVHALPHSSLNEISITTIGGKDFNLPLSDQGSGEIGLRRMHLDQLLLSRAADAGATILEESPVQEVRREWKIRTADQEFEAHYLVAADGRNSTVSRLLGLLPASQKDRVGLQTHFPIPAAYEAQVRMELLPQGYSGGASIGEGLWNLCLVARPQHIDSMKRGMLKRWKLPEDQPWRTVTPLSRAAVSPAQDRLLLVGDAARVVEPFTGEGIYYALRSGELAAKCIIAAQNGKKSPARSYARAHAELYRGRLWLNHLTRLAVLHPAVTSWMLERFPLQSVLSLLTKKVTAPVSGCSVPAGSLGRSC